MKPETDNFTVEYDPHDRNDFTTDLRFMNESSVLYFKAVESLEIYDKIHFLNLKLYTKNVLSWSAI